MTGFRSIEQRLQKHLGLARRPVAVSFPAQPPEGFAKFEGSQPSSCAFWPLAAEGRAFYTVPGDHFNCPIGSYTHNTPAPEGTKQLNDTLGLMSSIGYVRMEEVPQIFHLPEPPRYIAYAPLAEAPGVPGAVLFAGRPGRLMLLAEAAIRAGVMSRLPLLARPTCMAIPAAMSQGAVMSAGCIGNRVYTGIGEDELYMVVPGVAVERLAGELDTIAAANATLTQYHQERRATLTRAE